MTLTHRPFCTVSDLQQIGALIRCGYTAQPGLNAWSFARYDIWAQRRLAEEQILGRRGWQTDIALWESPQDGLAGVVFFESSRQAVLIQHPAYPELAEAMVAWAEAQHARKRIHDAMRLEVCQGNEGLEELLNRRGYIRPTSHFTHRLKRLNGGYDPVRMPPGFQIQLCQTPAALHSYHQAVHRVFNWLDTLEVHQVIQQAPSFAPELQLIACTLGGEVAAFSTVWVDMQNNLAEFEPVGTVPEYRRLGLGAALLAEACNRLRGMGIGAVSVFSWGESLPANRLYEAAGLRLVDRIYNWRRDR